MNQITIWQILNHSHLRKTSDNDNKKNSETDKIYLYAKDPYEVKYQFLISKRESTGLKHLNDSKAFIEYSNDMDGIYKNIEENNPIKKQKILIVFDDMIADMLSNKKLNPKLTELFNKKTRGKKLNIYHFLLHNVIIF